MTLSKEIYEYHLTPNGWVEGSFKGDAIGGETEVEIPVDRVLTIKCYDELPHVFAKPLLYDKIIWKTENKVLLEKLKNQYGKRPDWFGYKQM